MSQTRMHSSRMRTAHSSSRDGGSPPGTPPGPDPPPRAGTPAGAGTPWTRPPCGQNSSHTLLKILPCPKLRLRAVKIIEKSPK